MIETPRSILFGCVELERSQPLRDRLRRDGLQVLASSRTEEFLELAKRGAPDVIVLDDDLDALGGEMLIRLLRASCPQSRVILLLTPGSPPDREGLRHLGPVCTLVSPVPEANLKGVIGTALQMPSAVQAPLPRVILCVDDDRMFLKSLVRTLQRRDYSVIAYADPEEALQAIPVHNPAMAFVDVLMPGMNGLDLASEIREEYGTSLPVVLLSGKSSDEEIADGLRSGARYYVTKPCDPDRILDIADALVGSAGPPGRPVRGTPR
jgi:two-component system alkaline phosphatase synthesis response regulator PhoP